MFFCFLSYLPFWSITMEDWSVIFTMFTCLPFVIHSNFDMCPTLICSLLQSYLWIPRMRSRGWFSIEFDEYVILLFYILSGVSCGYLNDFKRIICLNIKEYFMEKWFCLCISSVINNKECKSWLSIIIILEVLSLSHISLTLKLNRQVFSSVECCSKGLYIFYRLLLIQVIR